jgi:hypothetical protein
LDIVLPLKLNPKKYVKITDITTCFLTVGKGEFAKEYQGSAACVEGDKFSKEIGRKQSLTRALEASKLSKGFRSRVWDSYFNRGSNKMTGVSPNSSNGNSMEGKRESAELSKGEN